MAWCHRGAMALGRSCHQHGSPAAKHMQRQEHPELYWGLYFPAAHLCWKEEKISPCPTNPAPHGTVATSLKSKPSSPPIHFPEASQLGRALVPDPSRCSFSHVRRPGPILPQPHGAGSPRTAARRDGTLSGTQVSYYSLLEGYYGLTHLENYSFFRPFRNFNELF